MTVAESLDELAERVFAFQCDHDTTTRLQAGLEVERIDAMTEDRAESGARFAQATLSELTRVPTGTLDHQRRLTYRSIEFYCRGLIGERDYYWLAPRVAPYSFPFPYLLETFRTFRFETNDDAERYLSLAADAARYVDSLRVFARGAHSRSIVLPGAEIDATLGVLRGFARGGTASPIAVARHRTAGLPHQDLFHERMDRAAGVLATAFEQLIAYLHGPYRAGAPDGVGQSQYPGGLAFYEHLVGRLTTLDRSYDAIHAFGLEEVARLEATLDELRGRIAFNGGLAEFRTFLNSDARFFASTGEELGARLKTVIADCEPGAKALFSRLPKTPYRVEPLPANLAASQTFGYYQVPTAGSPVGTYFYNASIPEKRSLLSAVSLMLHELIPGHHFQIARQQENAALPRLRRYDFESPAFCEGYAEYAAELGFDMGAYDDPYDCAGRIAMDLMMSARLVVDTGMNALGWSRERAMRYLEEHTFMTPEQITTETLRYACDLPAQALAYKCGEAEFLGLRRRAGERLRSQFKLCEFNDWLIENGTLTLPAVAEHVSYRVAETLS